MNLKLNQHSLSNNESILNKYIIFLKHKISNFYYKIKHPRKLNLLNIFEYILNIY
jgi:hypothetical protein